MSAKNHIKHEEVKAPEVKPEEVETKKAHVFGANDLDLADKHIINFHVFLPDGLTLKDIKPSSWAHLAHKLQPMAQIYVTSESNEFAALLRVMSCTNLDAVTEVIWEKKFATSNRASNQEYEVKWINNKEKYGVLRTADKVYVVTGKPTISEANQCLVNEMARTG